MQQLHIIDTLGPFAVQNNRATINWSKIDFSSLEVNGRIASSVHKKIVERFERYITRVASLGYDSISIDDLAHLAIFPFYKPATKRLLKDYRDLYSELFTIAKQHKLKIFVNSDYLFFNEDIDNYLKQNNLSPLSFYSTLLEQVFTTFPVLDGVVLRVGENDGKDVKGTFLSRLLLKTPAQANALLTQVLPLFEHHKKTLIFRTWTVGVYKIGDLIWNQKTYDAVFGSIKSDTLIVSMKFGDTDFMRYLTLNPLFSRGQHKKIIELQTRREWEGMGEFPSFVGWDYQKYFSQLADNKNIVGIHVWCQTGGWAKQAWSGVTYLDNHSFWNELNTEVTISIAKYGLSTKQAIKRFCESRNIGQVAKFTELLSLSDTAILKGLYLPAIAKNPLYFRRSRVPPLTWLTWDKVHLPPAVIALHRLLIPSSTSTIRDADEAVKASDQMVRIAQAIGLSSQVINSLKFERDTLILFAQIKRYIFRLLSPQQTQQLNTHIRAYGTRYPQHYSVPELAPLKKDRLPPRSLLNLFIRDTLAYRKRDRALLKTSPAQAKLVRLYLRRSKSHLTDQSMGFEVFFK
jgi:hypothetical protein